MVLGKQSMRSHYLGTFEFASVCTCVASRLEERTFLLPSMYESIRKLSVVSPSKPCYTWIHLLWYPHIQASCWPLSRPNSLAVTSWSGHDIRHCGLSFQTNVALISDLHS